MVQPVSAADYYRLILMIDAVIMSNIKGQREYGAFQQQIQRQKLKIRVAAAVFNADFKVDAPILFSQVSRKSRMLCKYCSLYCSYRNIFLSGSVKYTPSDRCILSTGIFSLRAIRIVSNTVRV